MPDRPIAPRRGDRKDVRQASLDKQVSASPFRRDGKGKPLFGERDLLVYSRPNSGAFLWMINPNAQLMLSRTYESTNPVKK